MRIFSASTDAGQECDKPTWWSWVDESSYDKGAGRSRRFSMAEKTSPTVWFPPGGIGSDCRN